jgi:hypothetical protein
LTFCDIQILTGLGILLGGFIGLKCYLSAYHWQLIAYLAWFSNLTYVACLTVLRRHLHQRKLQRSVRLVVMTVQWIGLLVSLVPTRFFNWMHSDEQTESFPGSDARCYFKRDTDSSESTAAYESAIISILLTGFGFISRSIKLIRVLSLGTRTQIRGRMSHIFIQKILLPNVHSERPGRPVKRLRRLYFIVSVHLIGKICTDIMASEFFDVRERLGRQAS